MRVTFNGSTFFTLNSHRIHNFAKLFSSLSVFWKFECTFFRIMLVQLCCLSIHKSLSKVYIQKYQKKVFREWHNTFHARNTRKLAGSVKFLECGNSADDSGLCSNKSTINLALSYLPICVTRYTHTLFSWIRHCLSVVLLKKSSFF